MTDPQTNWQAEYEFYRKIIADEVDRLRFNAGYEPIEVDLYPVTSQHAKMKFIGTCRIGRQGFRAVAFPASDAQGNKVLRVQIRHQPHA
jgi:hypothetical protein